MSEIKPIPVIKPTIGRRIWFRCNDSFAKEKGIYRIDDAQAMDAGIVYVHGDTMVNLIITDHIGNTHAVNSVVIVGDTDGNSHAMWCEWMPYQKEQAKTVKSTEPTADSKACADGSVSSNGYQLNAKRDNAFLVAQLLSNNKISAELRKKAETKMDALLDQLI